MSSTPTHGVTEDGTAYELVGPENAPVIVLIHGLGLCSQLWQQHMPEFSRRYRVLNYDLYGHGDSAPPPQTASLKVYADQLAKLLDALELTKVSVVGFSIGGMINRRFALDYPQHLTSLVILNSPHNRGEELQHQVELRAKKVKEQGASATMSDALKRWFTSEYLQNSDGANQVVAWREQVDAESYAQAAWVLANGVRELVSPNTPISTPTLVITCENDSGSTPAMSHAIANEIHGARTLIIPRLQHLGLLEDAPLFTQPILSFLNEQT